MVDYLLFEKNILSLKDIFSLFISLSLVCFNLLVLYKYFISSRIIFNSRVKCIHEAIYS